MTAILLYPFTIIYRLAIWIWTLYWRFGNPISIPAKIIAVGGLTVGGSGKTSVTIFLTGKLISRGMNAAVAARGYKREGNDDIIITGDSRIAWEDCGDEPMVMARSVPGLKVYISSDKTSAATDAARAGHDPIIIDDGFQHRKLKRDIDIVCLDGSDPLGGGMLLPSGRMREPLSALQRADIIMIIDPAGELPGIRMKLPLNIPVFIARKKSTGIKPIKGEMGELSGSECLAFCGLGNPASFKSSLEKAGYRPTEFIEFRDHHNYCMADVQRITKRFEATSADFLITTLKDAVKLEKIWNNHYPLYYLEIEIEVENEDELFEMIER